MRKIILIGKTGCGKTTLGQRLLGETVSYRKTQSINIIGDEIVDTPGEYLERKQFYNALLVTAVEADVILLLLSAVDEQSVFSPRMNSMFGEKPVIGVITKSDLCNDPVRIENCCEILKLSGAGEIQEIGFHDDGCIQRLRERIEESGNEKSGNEKSGNEKSGNEEQRIEK